MTSVFHGDTPRTLASCALVAALASVLAGTILFRPHVIHAQSRPAAPAPTAAPLTLGAVYGAVDRGTPRLRAAAASARAADARVDGARRPPDPELQLGLMNYMVPDFVADPLLGMRQLQLMQMVPLPGKLAAAGAAARARADASGAWMDDARWATRARAADAFLGRWEALERAQIAQATRRLLEDASEVAASSYRVGDGSQSDVLRARVEVARMDAEVIREQAMADGALSRLAGVLDVPEDSIAAPPLLPAFPSTVPTRESLEAMALADRPVLAAGRAEVEAATADARLARRERWPDLRLGVQYGERSTGMGTDRMGSLMVGASIPIWAGSRQLRMRDEAEAMHEFAVADLVERESETRARVAEVRAELMASQGLAALYRTTVLPQAEAAAVSALSAYRAGDGGFLEVVEHRMTENRYRRELVALDAAQARAWAEIEMLTGRSFLTTDAASPRDPGR